VLQKKSGLSQKRDQPILVVTGSQNKNPLAAFLDQFVSVEREMHALNDWVCRGDV